MKEDKIRDLVQYTEGDPTNPTPVPRDDDGHPDARVQRALDKLDDALADWSADSGLTPRGYVLILVTKDEGGAVFRSVSEHEMPLDQAMVAMGSQS